MSDSASGYSAAELAPWALEIHRLLAAAGLPHALIGGAVVQLYGRRARTRDVDYLVSLESHPLADLIQFLTHEGLRVERKADWHLRVWKSDSLYADLIVAEMSLQAEFIRKAVLRDVAGALVPVVTPEHLIVLKRVAGRPRDLRDIEDVRECTANLDDIEIARWLAEFDLPWPPAR